MSRGGGRECWAIEAEEHQTGPGLEEQGLGAGDKAMVRAVDHRSNVPRHVGWNTAPTVPLSLFPSVWLLFNCLLVADDQIPPGAYSLLFHEFQLSAQDVEIRLHEHILGHRLHAVENTGSFPGKCLLPQGKSCSRHQRLLILSHPREVLLPPTQI